MTEGEDESVVTLVATERPQRTLDELARIAREANTAIEAHMAESVRHAFICGEALLAARDIIIASPSVAWREWCKTEVGISEASATNFIRLAYYRDRIPEEALRLRLSLHGHKVEPSVHHLLNYVHGLPRVRNGWENRGGHPSSLKAEALRLRSTGMAYADIARMLGVNSANVNGWCNPEAVRARQKRLTERKRAQRAARKALEAQERDRANVNLAKDVGGELAKAYSTQRQALSSLSLSLDSTDNTTARQAIRNAITRGHQAEAEILDALRAVRGDS